MKLVVDANVLFSAFIKEGKTIELLLNPSFIFYTPIFVFEEIEEHKNEIIEKMKRTKEEIQDLIDNLLSLIKLIPKQEIIQFIGEAEGITNDLDDVAYIALALKLNCAIWSNDKKLKEQGRIKVYSTEELVGLLEEG